MVIPGGLPPIDLALGVALPVHSHIALNFVRTREPPRDPRPLNPTLEDGWFRRF